MYKMLLVFIFTQESDKDSGRSLFYQFVLFVYNHRLTFLSDYSTLQFLNLSNDEIDFMFVFQ